MTKWYIGNGYWGKKRDMGFKVNANSLNRGNLNKFAGNISK